MNTNDKIIKLREQMRLNRLDAYIIYTEDAHGSEYPADYWKFREYISGFNGSAGVLVVTNDHAGLWTDSRYFLQAEKQLRGSSIELHRMGMPGVPSYSDYLTYLLPSGGNVGLNGFTLSFDEYLSISRKLERFGINIEERFDFASELFVSRPALPSSQVWLMKKGNEGLDRKQKVAVVRRMMAEQKASHYIVSSLDEIAWLTNMRGSDVEYNPVFYAHMIITPEEEHLFIDPHKMTVAVSKQLEEDGITLSLYDHFEIAVGDIPDDARVFFDPKRISACVVFALNNDCVTLEGPSLIDKLKSKKTPFEISRIEQAHIRDGVALVKFARWLMQSVGNERLTELDLSQKLTAFRAEGQYYLSDSFQNIIAYGPNAAIVHYAPTLESNAVIEPLGLLLVDSGAQYEDGTTDITRTFALGPISESERLHYTLVLKGHIALATTVFPEGTRGLQLDSIARQSMWRYGIDYGHGTGHGVGYCLNVHEGPQSISKKPIDTPMEIGMLTSDEPGIYVEGSHGIRIENLTVCVEMKKTNFGDFYGFKTVTLFPIDTAPIKEELLTNQELKWLNNYHAQVYAALSGYLEGEDLEWLREACREI